MAPEISPQHRHPTNDPRRSAHHPMQNLKKKEQQSATSQVINLAMEAVHPRRSHRRPFALQMPELHIREMPCLPSMHLRLDLIDGVPAPILDESINLVKALLPDDFRCPRRMIIRHLHREPFCSI